jgi:hypothetical protein
MFYENTEVQDIQNRRPENLVMFARAAHTAATGFILIDSF